MGLFKAVNISANALKFIIAIVGVAMAVYVAYKWDAEAENVNDILPTLSTVINIVTVVLVATAIIAVLFGLVKFFSNITKNIPQLIGVLAFLAILAFAWYGLTTWELNEYLSYRGGDFVDPEKEHGLTQGLVQLADGGVWAVLLLIPLAVVAAVVSEVTKFFK